MVKTKAYLTFYLLVACMVTVVAQSSFQCLGQIFTIIRESESLAVLTVNEGNNSVRYNIIREDLGMDINALGFRSTDQFLYGIREGSRTILRLDREGNIMEIAVPELDPTLFYLAGDFSNDGRYFVVVGRSSEDNDQGIFFIDMLDNFKVSVASLGGNTTIEDIAQDPTSGLWYGYDSSSRNVLFFNPDNGVLTGLYKIREEDDLESLFFDAFGNLYGVGSTAFTIAHTLFEINKESGELKMITTGPQTFIRDLAACPYTVDLILRADASTVLPCTSLEMELEIGHQYKNVLTGLDLSLTLPTGLTFNGLKLNQLDQLAVYDPSTRTLAVNDFAIDKGNKFVRFDVAVEDVPAEVFTMQAFIKGLPIELGEVRESDNPDSDAFDDALAIALIRPEEDSIIDKRLLCSGSSLILDASPYGNGLVWNNGSKSLTRLVDESGKYWLKSENECLDIYVEFDVTKANCPYTIEVEYEVDPPEFFPCTQVVMRYIFRNDSGLPHDGLSFINNLPEPFSYLGILKANSNITASWDEVSKLLKLDGITMQEGIDTLEILVEVGDVPPMEFKNRAILEGFPEVLGPNRWTDDPRTVPLDSTVMRVLGTLDDTTYVDVKLCRGDSIYLDSAPYGIDQAWENISTDSLLLVTSEGTYHLKVFDGCTPADVYFNVTYAKSVRINLQEEFTIHLGDSLWLIPEIYNEGETLAIQWTGKDSTSMNCGKCLENIVFPYSDQEYRLSVQNEECSDSITVFVKVDHTRRIFYPNVFSPNADGVNDLFRPLSMDYGFINEFVVYDRWGNRIYETGQHYFDDAGWGWDGTKEGQPIHQGVYFWKITITFLDGVVETFGGDVTVLK